MSINEDELQLARTKPQYWAGVWAFRVMLAVAVLGGVTRSAGLFRTRAGLAAVLILVLATGVVGYALLDRAGVRIFGLSQGIWARRRMVYKDIFRPRPRG